MEYILLIGVFVLFLVLRQYRKKLGAWRWVLGFSCYLYLLIDHFFLKNNYSIWGLILLALFVIGGFLYEEVYIKKRSRID